MLNAPHTPRWRAWLLLAVACWAGVAPAFATAFVSGFNVRGPETRVWNFFANYGGNASDEGSQVADSHQGNEGYGYETASGVHVYLYANGDPVMRRDPSGRYTLVEAGMGALVLGTIAMIAVPQVLDMGIRAARTLIEAAVYGAEKTAEGANRLYSLTLALEVMKANEKAHAKPVSLLLQDPAQGKAVIGESMTRVTAAAVTYNAETFDPIIFFGSMLPSFPLQSQSDFNYWLWANRAWIRSAMVRHLLLIDIGRDATKVGLGIPQSQFYSMELEETASYMLKINEPWPPSFVDLRME